MSDRKRVRHRVFMIGFIASPLVVLVVLTYAIVIAFETGPSMMAEPVGAGAGRTGGANALGQSLFSAGEEPGIPAERVARGVVLLVRDLGGLASTESPVLFMRNWDGFETQAAHPMTLREDGAWSIQIEPPDADEKEVLAFRFGVVEDGRLRVETDRTGTPLGARRLPRVSDAQAVGDTPLVYEFRIRGWE